MQNIRYIKKKKYKNQRVLHMLFLTHDVSALFHFPNCTHKSNFYRSFANNLEQISFNSVVSGSTVKIR